MGHRGNFPLECKIYVGGLPNDATTQELEEEFSRFGRLRKVWVAHRPPGFAFIEYEDDRDAEDAVRAMDGARVCGVRVRCEVSHGRRRGDAPPPRYGGGGGGYNRRRSRSPPPMRGRSRSRSRDRQRRTRSRSPRENGFRGRSRSRSRS